MRVVVTIPRVFRQPKLIAHAARKHLHGVVATNRWLLRMAKRRGKPFPSIYRSDVVFQREPNAGKYERFDNLLTTIKRGWGDCDDLAAWRVAELREQGEPANFKIYWRLKNGRPKLFHVQVRRADGSVEDPARALGM